MGSDIIIAHCPVKLREDASEQAIVDEKNLYQFELNYKDRDPLAQEALVVWSLLTYPWSGGLRAEEFTGENIAFPSDGRAVLPALKRLKKKGLIRRLDFGYWDFVDARTAVAWIKNLWPRWCLEWPKVEANAEREELEKLKCPEKFGL